MTQWTLGTASFGIPGYGLAKSAVTAEAARQMLRHASEHGCAFDTAAAYGNAEELIGATELFGDPPVTTKLLPELAAHDTQLVRLVEGEIRASRARLRMPAWRPLTALLHTPAQAADSRYVAALAAAAGAGLATEVGASLYDPAVVPAGLGVIQAPYSVFDRRWDAQIRTPATARMVARAPFCQGLAFCDPAQLTGTQAPYADMVEALQKTAQDHGIGVAEACLRFALEANPSELVFGVDSLEQLEENLGVRDSETPQAWPDCYQALLAAIPADRAVVNPSLWAGEAE